MDTDLAEALESLKGIFQTRRIKAVFGPMTEDDARRLKKSLGLTARFTAFLKASAPLDVETRTPSERIRFIPPADLEREQVGFGRGNAETPANPAWKPGWIVIGHSSLLGDPYFLDTTRPDPEGDCPVMTAMVGSNRKPTLCASNFSCFLRILATAMDVAKDFPAETIDPDDEDIFREALGPKVRIVDPAALREGHWT